MNNSKQGGWIIYKDKYMQKSILRACEITKIAGNRQGGVTITTTVAENCPGHIDLWIGAIKTAMSYPQDEYIEIDNYKE